MNIDFSDPAIITAISSISATIISCCFTLLLSSLNNKRLERIDKINVSNNYKLLRLNELKEALNTLHGLKQPDIRQIPTMLGFAFGLNMIQTYSKEIMNIVSKVKPYIKEATFESIRKNAYIILIDIRADNECHYDEEGNMIYIDVINYCAIILTKFEMAKLIICGEFENEIREILS